MKRCLGAFAVLGLVLLPGVALGDPAQSSTLPLPPVPSLTSQQAASVTAAGNLALTLPQPANAAELAQQETLVKPYINAVSAQGTAAGIALTDEYAWQSPAIAAVLLQGAKVVTTEGTSSAPLTAGSVHPDSSGCDGDNSAWVSTEWYDSFGIELAKLQINANGWCWNGATITKVYSPYSQTYNGVAFPDTCWANYSHNQGSWLYPYITFHMGQWGAPGVGVSNGCAATGNQGATTLILEGLGDWNDNY